ncbi:hypothetical protein KP509_1Z135800 [Ceratopteris richardii]|nr:hypothetical protein KP509_1Z135800 [Ceratopteris richardii]
MAFKRGISTDIHNILGSWDPSLETPLGWFHVTCDAAGRVIRLEVNGIFLVGHIPPVLRNVLNLVSLDLSHNFLSGPIPLGFDNFIRGKLKFLFRPGNPRLCGNVSYNHLEGFVSPSFSKYSIRSFRPGNPRLCGAPPINSPC